MLIVQSSAESGLGLLLHFGARLPLSIQLRALAVLLCACGACSNAGPSLAPGRGGAELSAPAAGDARTLMVVDAANAFIATLSDVQKAAVQFAFKDSAQRARWSNFPQGIFKRKGVAWGDLDASQRAALTNLLGAVLSPMGMKMIKEQMDADDELKNNASSGGGLLFGSDFYFVSFLGMPSATSPWMLQFGGHHLAINATVSGPDLTISPSLTGGQPVKYAKDGRPIYIVEKEVAQAGAMLRGLTAEQRTRAVISTQIIDLVLGPTHDDKTLQPEGLPASEMTQVQKDQFLALIEARLGILNADDFAATMADVRKNLNQTYFAWYGPTTNAGAAYFRATGPTIVMEFSPQSMGGDASNHLHNMYRNPTNDYGAAWAQIK